MNTGHSLVWLWMTCVLAVSTVRAADATLAMTSGHTRLVFSQQQLLARDDVQTIVVPDSVYHDRVTRFRAIPIARLFRGITVPDGAVIRCTGTDGFSAILARAPLLSADANSSKAFLAIEEPENPWPPLQGKDTSAGPFYLVWTNPKASGIGREEWPFKIASFEVVTDPRRLFPNLYPAADAPQTVRNGVDVFQRNCFACHRMNGNGAASLGPDLNLPMNPTEYFTDKALAALIRDPATVRRWSGMSMPGFPASLISDSDLTDLIAYLGYMRSHKVTS